MRECLKDVLFLEEVQDLGLFEALLLFMYLTALHLMSYSP